eukprot:12990386-Ditylum_brightwellii.AAC.1
MRQGDPESNDGFLKRFKANTQTLELAGGEHIFCSSQLEGDSLGDNKKGRQLNNSRQFISSSKLI